MKRIGEITLSGCLTSIAGGVFCRLESSTQGSAKQRAIADLKQNAYAGNVNAQLQLGVIYLTGDGVARDDAEAVKWLTHGRRQGQPTRRTLSGRNVF